MLTFFFIQALEQYFTFSQSRSHFFLQLKGRPHTEQIFDGRFDLRIMVKKKLERQYIFNFFHEFL